MSSQSIEKTAFSPGPGYGLWEFTVMPYGLTGATQTCQRGIDEVLKDCKDCVDNYVDDCIIFSDDVESHVADVDRVLGKLQAAGFTLHGSKCYFGRNSASHLGFVYTQNGVIPSEEKTRAVANCPTPKSAKEVRSFLGLVNFYRKFVPKFADIANPLNDLTGNRVKFKWEDKHRSAFETLKNALVAPPILDYPKRNDKFVLATDASDLGLGAVLSTSRGTVNEFASRTLTTTERNYATIEKECLAIVWATQKFIHYLVGGRFTLETDHKPLEWLESAKASHARSQRLERWSLELRAYDFDVVYRPGASNQHADALSRKPIGLVAVQPVLCESELSDAQRRDTVLQKVIEQVEKKTPPPATEPWTKFPFRRYKQVWSQLTLQGSVLYRRTKSPTMEEEQLQLIVPRTLRMQFMKHAHDAFGHQGIDRTMARLSETVYWVGMGADVARYCNGCKRCQLAKAPENRPAPLQPVIAIHPWEMVAVDILKVPMSTNGNQYILVAQDYFSKWPFAIPMPDQTAERIVEILRDEVFTLVPPPPPPQKLHSDQGRNFESRILGDLCNAFGVKKAHTTPYHPMGDGLVERTNRSLLALLRTFVDKESDWERHLQTLLFSYRTSKHTSTGVSPYEVLFGSNPPSLLLPQLPTTSVPEPSDYSTDLQRKLCELRELVDANLVNSAEQQQHTQQSSQGKARP